LLQYVIYKAIPNYLITEYWMEPTQSGKLRNNRNQDLFNSLFKGMLETDIATLSAVTTYDTLITSSPEKLRDKLESDMDDIVMNDVIIQHAPINLLSVLNSCSKVSFSVDFTTFPNSGESVVDTSSNHPNRILYDLLLNTIDYISDCGISLDNEDIKLNGMSLSK
jgi:signal transduction histidine kinase